jgi:putative membrane protein insertion efficiency factor
MRPALARIGRAVAWLWNHSVGWVLAWGLILPIRAYQRFISPLTPPSCRLHPSCSAYAVEAIQTHGAIKGFVLSCWRLVRCNPWNRGGLDPVPAKGYWLPDVLPNGEPRHGTMSTHGPADTSV